MQHSMRERSRERNEDRNNVPEIDPHNETNNPHSYHQSSSNMIDGVDVNAALQAAMANAIKISAARIV